MLCLSLFNATQVLKNAVLKDWLMVMDEWKLPKKNPQAFGWRMHCLSIILPPALSRWPFPMFCRLWKSRSWRPWRRWDELELEKELDLMLWLLNSFSPQTLFLLGGYGGYGGGAGGFFPGGGQKAGKRGTPDDLNVSNKVLQVFWCFYQFYCSPSGTTVFQESLVSSVGMGSTNRKMGIYC